MTKRSSVAVLVLVVAGACGSSAKPAPQPPVKSEAPPSPLDTSPVDAPVVTLVSAGRAPHQALRYAPVRGARSEVQMRITMGASMEVGGATMPLDIPPMTMGMETIITEVATNTFDMAARVTAADVEDGAAAPAVIAATRPALAKLVGMTMLARMDRRGRIIAADVSMPAGVDPSLAQTADQLRQSMSQATAPFPEEPVGVGARWTVVSQVETTGIKMTQTAHFELTELSAERGTADVVIDQEAPTPQVMKVANASPDLVATLESFASDARGRLMFDLVGVMPAAFELGIDLEMGMSMTQVKAPAAAPIATTMKMGMEVTMATTPAAN